MSVPARTALPPLHTDRPPDPRVSRSAGSGDLATDAYSFWYGERQALFDVSIVV